MTPLSGRPIVLVLTAHYLPGYKAGGPIRTIRNLVASLGDEFDFRIVTSDRDYGDRSPFAGVAVNDWNEVDGARVYYADAAALRPMPLARTIAAVAPDVVYLNSFFSPRFSIAPLLLRRLGLLPSKAAWIVAPRGEFARDAISMKSLKKRSYMAMARAIGLHRGVRWQASSPHEAGDIEREVGVPRDAIQVAPNLTALVDRDLPAGGPPPDRPRLSVCFLARVCEMKNLAFVIETLVRCRSAIDLHVYGPVEDRGYADRCRAIVPPGDSRLAVTWHGEVPHEEVRTVLAAHDLFFLPSLGENFGHGIFEALAAGVPILLSDRTPWRGLEAAGVGWDFPLDSHEPFVRAIETLASMSADERRAMRERAHRHAMQVADSSEARDANRRLLAAESHVHSPVGQSSSTALPAGSAFHEGLAAAWSRGYAVGGFRRRLEFLAARMNGRVRSGQTWLDAGCGTGVLARELAARGASVIAMDASPAMLAHANDDPASGPLPIRYQLIESVDALPLPENAADGVLCSSVLEYVDDPAAALREFRRVLRHDGVLILSVPNRRSIIRMGQQVVRQVARLFGISVFAYLSVSRHAYGRGSIAKTLVQAGFEPLETHLFSPLLPRLLVPLGLGALWVVVARRGTT